jgi:hypothetical protein
MLQKRVRLRVTARSAVAMVAALVVVAGPGAPTPVGPVEATSVLSLAESAALPGAMQPAQGEPGPPKAPGGSDDGGDSGGEAVAGKPSGPDDSSSGGEGSAPEPAKPDDAPSAGEAAAPEPAKADDAPAEASGNGPAPEKPQAEVTGGGPQQPAPPAAAAPPQPGPAGDAAGAGQAPEAQVAGGTPPPTGAPASGGPDTAAPAVAAPPTTGPAPAEGADAVTAGVTPPSAPAEGTQAVAAGTAPPAAPGTEGATVTGTPGGPPAAPLAVSGGTPVTVDPGAEAALKQYQAGLPPEARSQPLDFGSTAVGPDKWSPLVTQEGGNVEQFNSAVQTVGGPDAKVTQSPILLRDDQGRFGTSTLFQVTGANGQSQLVDAQGAMYKDVNDYLENNQLDDSWTMIRAAQPGAAGDGTQQLVSGPAHNTTFSQRVGKIGDAAAPYVMVAGGALVVGTSAVGEVGTAMLATPVAAPAAVWGTGLMAAGGAWIASRSGEDLFNRYQHGRSLGWSDPQARADYLGLAGGAGGGAGAVAKLARRSMVAAGGDSLLLGAGGQAVADGGVQLHDNWENLTPEQQSKQLTQVLTGGALMAVPLVGRTGAAGRGSPSFEGPFLPKNAPSGAKAEAERNERAAGNSQLAQADGEQPQGAPAASSTAEVSGIPAAGANPQGSGSAITSNRGNQGAGVPLGEIRQESAPALESGPPLAGAKTPGQPIGYAPGTVDSVLTSGRLQHGTDHLMKTGLLPPWSGKKSPALIKEKLTPILERPRQTFDTELRDLGGPVPVKGFLGAIDGRDVAVLVYKEGARKGQLATSYVPTPNQYSKWGVTPP